MTASPMTANGSESSTTALTHTAPPEMRSCDSPCLWVSPGDGDVTLRDESTRSRPCVHVSTLGFTTTFTEVSALDPPFRFVVCPVKTLEVDVPSASVIVRVDV